LLKRSDNILNDNIRNESSEALLDDTNPRENAEKYLQHVALHLNSVINEGFKKLLI